MGVAVLLVDLLTTGGIGLPSVAGTLWLLLALGLSRRTTARSARLCRLGRIVRDDRPGGGMLQNSVQSRVGLSGPVAAGRAGAGPRRSSIWRPPRQPTRCRPSLGGSWPQSSSTRGGGGPGADGFRRFETANAQVLALAPNSAPAWLAAGDWYFRAYSKLAPSGKTTANDAIQKALSAYRRAAQAYPNSELYRAKLAEASRAAENRPAVRRGKASF